MTDPAIIQLAEKLEGCHTPGCQFHIETSARQISISVDLPEGVDIIAGRAALDELSDPAFFIAERAEELHQSLHSFAEWMVWKLLRGRAWDEHTRPWSNPPWVDHSPIHDILEGATAALLQDMAGREERLREALKPFGAAYSGGKNLRDETRVMPLAQGGRFYEFCLDCGEEFTVGDLRRARAALLPEPSAPPSNQTEDV